MMQPFIMNWKKLFSVKIESAYNSFKATQIDPKNKMVLMECT
jgi:hypothetical protein